MPWGHIYLLNLAPNDKIISSSADDYIKHYMLVRNKCFRTSRAASDKYRHIEEGDYLGKVTAVDKMMVVSHGSKEGKITYMDREIDGRTLAILFASWGIRNAGLITFKCCHLGKNSFLEDFRDACDNKINVGYLKGYLHETATEWRINLRTLQSKPHEAVKHSKGYRGVAVSSQQDDRYRCIPGNNNGPEVQGRAYRDAMDVGDMQ